MSRTILQYSLSRIVFSLKRLKHLYTLDEILREMNLLGFCVVNPSSQICDMSLKNSRIVNMGVYIEDGPLEVGFRLSVVVGR